RSRSSRDLGTSAPRFSREFRATSPLARRLICSLHARRVGVRTGERAMQTTTETPAKRPAPESAALNGLDTQKMGETVNALKSDPTLARFEFRNENRWIQGGENRSSIRGFYGAGREDDSRDAPFVFTNGEPPVLLGHNEGANPVEFLLHALAGCVTSTFMIHATARGIPIKHIETKLKGEIDLQGLLDLKEG